MKVNVAEHRNGFTINVTGERPARYFDEFCRLKCGPQALPLMPNAKELTESMSVFPALKKALGHEAFQDPRYTLMDICCGSTPRVAGLMALRSKWQCYAFDPKLNMSQEHLWAGIERLHVFPVKFQQFRAIGKFGRRLVLVTMHGHLSLPEILAQVEFKTWDYVGLLCVPCCIDLSLPGAGPDFEYEDSGIWSPQRKVRYYEVHNNRMGLFYEQREPRPVRGGSCEF